MFSSILKSIDFACDMFIFNSRHFDISSHIPVVVTLLFLLSNSSFDVVCRSLVAPAGMVAIPLVVASLFLQSHGTLEGQAAALSAWTQSVKSKINPPHHGNHCMELP